MKASIGKDNSDRVLKPKNNVNDKLDNEIEKMRSKLIEQMGKTNKRKRATSNSRRSENIRRPNTQCKDSSVTQHPKPITWQPARADSLQPSGHGKNRNLDGPSGSQSKSRYETRDSNRSHSYQPSGSRSKSRSRSRHNYRQSDRSPLRKNRKSKSKSRDRCSSKSKRSPSRKISFSSSQSKSRSKSRDSRTGSRRMTRERSSSGESCRARSRSRNSQEHQFIDNEEEKRIKVRITNQNQWKPNKNAQERMALDVDLESYFSSHPQQGARKPYERQTESKENENQQFSSREASVFNRLGPPK